MKKVMKGILTAFLAFTMVLLYVIIPKTEIHGAYYTTMYYNDRPWYLSNKFPIENVYGTNYLPITLFLQLPDVDVRVNETLNTFIITHGDYYLSFDVSTNFAANQDRLRMYITTAEYHGERYVPAKIVCMYLNLEYEEITSRTTGETVVRIADKNHQKTFKEVLNQYYPSFVISEPDQNSPNPNNPSVDEPNKVPVLSERSIYIAVDLKDGKYADDILEVLKKYNCSATFFLAGQLLEDNPRLLSKIAALGHEIAIGGDGDIWSGFSNAEEIVGYIENSNKHLYAAIRKKSAVIGRPTDGGELLSEEAKKALEDAGYFTWDGNVTVSQNVGAYTGANTAIKGIRNNKTAAIRFTEGRYIKDTLERVLKFVDGNRSVCEILKVSPLYSGYEK